MVVAVAAELMTTTRLQGILGALDCPVSFPEALPEAVRAAIGERPGGVVVVDLTVAPEVRAAAFTAARQFECAVIAFGPHVDTDALAAARTAGAAAVLSRGALTHGLGPLVAKHLARPGGIAGPSPS